MTLAFQSASELTQKIQDKEISSRELTDYYIDRIERFDGKINAVPVHDFDTARNAADQADAEQAAGRSLGPLHGLPMTIKEAYDISHLPTTWGIENFAKNIAQTDSQVVKKFKAAGAHFIGKTNVPEGLADFQSYNSIYGTTNNPWDVRRTPGGSSGGSSAALAAGFCGLESGSDIGGSIRNPAHFCGVYGHKPTWGIVPSQGHALPGDVAPPDIAVVGPMARSAQDLALAMNIMAGPDPLNSPGWTLSLPDPGMTGLKDFKIAIWPDDPLSPVSSEMSGRVQEIGDRLAKLGATVSDKARPDIDVAMSRQTYFFMLNGVLGAHLPQEETAALTEKAAGYSSGNSSPGALTARSLTQSHQTWLAWNNRREILRMAWQEFFQDWDILICPQMATTAFKHDQSHFNGRRITFDNAEHPYFEQLLWSGHITVAYLPSTVFPTGPGTDGLPIGLQAVGAEFNDRKTIRFAELMAQEFGGFTPPPGFDD
ncbi:amidase [Sneathiella marina]|uniref:Amidase n=1 Tax=Sneathiella marina TaxID=2950108 RepID=A0ABY4W305_9PROT|nr:amidase [Sneathiella marina]USG61580.1 amidase [Sneathiella marina]